MRCLCQTRQVLLISGVFAIFSTSTNLIAQGLLLSHGLPGFGNFDLAWPVMACTAATLVYVVVVAPILLRRFRPRPLSRHGKPGARESELASAFLRAAS